jgi:hypothetical protein
MTQHDLAYRLSESRLPKISQQLRFLFIIFIAIGAIMLTGGFLGVQSQRVFQVYLVNFAFWTGLAQAGVAFAAIYRMTNGGWSDQFRRIGEIFIAFLPVSFLLLFIILIVQSQLYPWITEPIPKKAAWLNSPFFTLRLLVYFATMTGLSYYYVATSIRPDVGLLRETGKYDEAEQSALMSRLVTMLTRNWKGYAEESAKSERRLKVLTPVFLISYGVIYTFVGFDLLMTLDPHWFSTLYGWLFVVSGFYSGVVALMMTGFLVGKNTKQSNTIGKNQFHDIGKLILGFCMFTGGLVFSQYLTIWYGNIPEETAHIIVRFHEAPWAVVSTGVLLTAYFIPLIFLFSKKIKQTPGLLFPLGILILLALWTNRFIETVPSIWHQPYIPFGLVEVGITLAFFAAVVLSWLWLARIVPLVPSRPEP